MGSKSVEASRYQLEFLNAEEPAPVPSANKEESFLSKLVIFFFICMLALWVRKVIFNSY